MSGLPLFLLPCLLSLGFLTVRAPHLSVSPTPSHNLHVSRRHKDGGKFTSFDSQHRRFRECLSMNPTSPERVRYSLALDVILPPKNPKNPDHPINPDMPAKILSKGSESGSELLYRAYHDKPVSLLSPCLPPLFRSNRT